MGNVFWINRVNKPSPKIIPLDMETFDSPAYPLLCNVNIVGQTHYVIEESVVTYQLWQSEAEAHDGVFSLYNEQRNEAYEVINRRASGVVVPTWAVMAWSGDSVIWFETHTIATGLTDLAFWFNAIFFNDKTRKECVNCYVAFPDIRNLSNGTLTTWDKRDPALWLHDAQVKVKQLLHWYREMQELREQGATEDPNLWRKKDLALLDAMKLIQSNAYHGKPNFWRPLEGQTCLIYSPYRTFEEMEQISYLDFVNA